MGYALKRYAIKWVILCCHLKAARRDATANLKCFGGRGHQRPNFGGFIYIRYAVPHYSTGISTIYLLPFGEV